MSRAGENRPSSPSAPAAPWIEISIEAPAAVEEDLAALLCDAGASGVRSEQSVEVVVLRASFADPATCPSEEEIRALIRGPAGSPAARLISVITRPDERWAERWIAALAPFPVGERFLVVPVPDLDAAVSEKLVGEPANTEPGSRIEISICPSRAFGTGEHATTRLCLEALESLALEGRSLLDVGTGSGILAIAAAKLGCPRIVALDVDPEAIDVARANLRLNGLAAAPHQAAAWETAVVDLVCGGIQSLTPGPFDVVVANLNGFILSSLASELLLRVASGGSLILSGLLDSEAEPIADRIARSDPPAGRVTRREGWACIVREGGRG